MMTTPEILAIMSKLTLNPTSLRHLHLAHAVFRLNAAEQFHARKRFRIVSISHHILGYRKYTNWYNYLPCGRRDGIHTNIDKCHNNTIYKCYYVLGIKRGKRVELHASGLVSTHGTFMNDYLDGVFTRYHADGSVASTQMFQGDQHWTDVRADI